MWLRHTPLIGKEQGTLCKDVAGHSFLSTYNGSVIG